MKAVLFDFGGTLDADGLSWGDRFYPLYREAGVAASREAFTKSFFKSDDQLPIRFNLKGLSLEKTIQLQVDCVLSDLAPKQRELETTISARFLADCRRIFDRNRPVLGRLKAKYRLGIVSNFYGNLAGVLESEGLSEYFETVADSAVVGHIKPSKEIFLHAAGKLGVGPADCLMVGDSVPRDMKGAEGLDMPHALLASNPSAGSCCSSALRLSALPDLEGLLP